MFGKNKKMQSNADVTDIGNGSSRMKAGSSSGQIQDFSGDVGRIGADKPLKEKKKNAGLASKGAKSKKALIQSISVPKTVQQSIPYRKVYTNGIIETEEGIFTKCYRLTDANFKTATQQTQEDMYFAYGDLLNYFSPDVRPQLLIFNRRIDMDKFNRETLFEMENDGYDEMREDMNSVLRSKISEGQSNITQEKYLIISIKAENIELANGTFSRVDGEISSRIKAINEHTTDPMELQDRLELLYNIYNQDTDVPFFKKMNIDGKEARTFDLGWMQSLGLTTKDVVGPSSMEFERDYLRLGDKYARVLYLRDLPTQLSAEILTDIANVPCQALTSVHFSPMRQDEGIKLVRNQMLEINRNVAEAAKRNAKVGLGSDLISPDLEQDRKDAAKAYDDITVRDQKSILMTVLVTVFADDLEELTKFTKLVQNRVEKHLCKISVRTSDQENGFNSCLPIGCNKARLNRLMNTESAALFIPFESMELTQPHGTFYGVNVTSRNLIMINRLRGQNSNGLILGMPGSGKSFTAKLEMAQAFLSSKQNEIFVIDPQAEYRPLCEALGGQVIRIAPGSDTHINPFDMDITYDAKDGDDPVTVKSDYICSICASAINGRAGLNPIQISVIDRCVRQLYEPYLAHMEELKRRGIKKTCDTNASPTFMDFYKILGRQPEPEARYIQIAIEKYCQGSYNTFSFRTNVDTQNRFVTYDIRDIGTGMNEIGMQVCLNDIKNRTIMNRKRNIRTWIYIDELYILTQSALCAQQLLYMWKQFRKYGGVPTGITQNVEDLLTNRESRGIINNSPFIVMLNQSNEDRREIGSMLHISESQLNYIKNAESGQGLVFCNGAIVPFVNKFLKNNKLYEILSTNPNEN